MRWLIMSLSPSEPWRDLLANPDPNGHIVQLYQDDAFFGEAITHFTAAGLSKGESVIIVATDPHWENISSRLKGRGFQVADLQRGGRLLRLDANLTLPKFLVNNMPDARMFKDIARATIKKARAASPGPGIRWWGEMVNVLYVEGNGRGSTRLEELFDEVSHEESVSIFCSFFMDKFDRNIYDGPLGDVCRTHRHLIPVQDETLHRQYVDQAVTDVFGTIDGPFLRAIASSKSCEPVYMPPSQELLLSLKQALPGKFEEVLAAARRREQQAPRKGSRE